MLHAAVALLCLRAVQATESSECKQSEADLSSMLQLGKVGVHDRGIAMQEPHQIPRQSIPWLPPKGGPAPTYTPLIIDEDGVMNEYYLPGAEIIDDGKTVKFEPPYRFYLMKEPTTDYSKAENFYKPDFMGKTFTVDFDFKPDGPACGCNLNFYLVDMPWPTAGDEGDYYCDAQCFQGKGCCAEFDMNEGNKEVQQVTNHACTGVGSYPGHPDWACNKWGDPELKTHQSDFSPGPAHTINSNQPFTWSQTFEMEGDQFVFTTVMTQGSKQTTLKMGPGNEQLNVMAGNISKGMVFVTGYWFDPAMNWLDGEECGSGQEHCNRNPAYLSNFRITTNGNVVPTPPTPPPAPTPPSPAPTPPPPGPGFCCWGGQCGVGCDMNPQAYCNRDQGACEGDCSGQWCR